MQERRRNRLKFDFNCYRIVVVLIIYRKKRLIKFSKYPEFSLRRYELRAENRKFQFSRANARICLFSATIRFHAFHVK